MTVMIRGSFADLLDPRMRRVTDEEAYKLHDDIVPYLWSMQPAQPRESELYSEISGLPMAGLFTGSFDYASFYQGYDITARYVEYGQGIQIERTLVEWDQTAEIEGRAKALVRSMFRRRQYDAVDHLRNATSVNTFFYTNSENVALASNSHTTTTGASTASGFDNLNTSAFSAAELAVNQIQMGGFRDMQAEPIEVVGDTIIAPHDLYESVWETVSSMGKVETAQNNRNVHFGAYDIIFLQNKRDFPDTNDWGVVDKAMMKEWCQWMDQVGGDKPEFGTAEEFDTMVAKYRAYARRTNVIRSWRWLCWNSVS